jgi:hypothetical protein
MTEDNKASTDGAKLGDNDRFARPSMPHDQDANILIA